MKYWIITYKNFRGEAARKIVRARNAREARDTFRAENKGGPNEKAKIISAVEQ